MKIKRRLIKTDGDVSFVERTISIPNLKVSFNNTLIVFMSDIHCGFGSSSHIGHAYITPIRFKQIIANIKSILNDYAGMGITKQSVMLALGGDLVNASYPWMLISPKMIPETNIKSVKKIILFLDSLPVAKKVYVLGNHDDCHSKRGQIITILDNERFVNLQQARNWFKWRGIRFIGLPDCTFNNIIKYQQNYSDRANHLFNNNQPKVVLAHNPTVFDKKYFNLVLKNFVGFSGHVHGGHFDATSTMPRRVLNWLALRVIRHPSRFIDGDYKIRGGVIEVSPGIGDHPSYTLFGSQTRSARREISFTILKYK